MTERNNDVTVTPENNMDVAMITSSATALDDSTKHCPAVLDGVNLIRREGTLCDASIVVGDKKIPVHKCVLVGGSDYFRSRFIGPLKGDNPEVDLSSVTDDVDSMEAVVNYLYTGKIKVDVDTLGTILKLASYLLVTRLRQFCINYMLKTVNLKTCLQYFLLAVEHDIKEVVEKLSFTVKSRFHDYYFIHNNTSIVSSNQLLFLINELNIFEHCNISNTLSFVLDWINNGPGNDETKELLACDILDFITEREKENVDNIHFNEYVDTYLDQITYLIPDTRVGPGLNSKIKEAEKLCNDLVERVLNQVSLYPLQSFAQHRSLDHSEREDVLIVLSPKQYLKDLTDLSGIVSDGQDIPDGKAIYDMCAYIPKTQTWCYIGEGVNEEFNLMRLLTYNTLSLSYKVCCYANTLCVVWPQFPFVCMMDISDFTWSSIDMRPILPAPESPDKCGERHFVCTHDTLYVILKWRVNIPNNEIYPTRIFFKCYRLTSEDTWLHMFSTPRIETQRRLDFEEVSAAISPESNQMIIVHNGSKLHAFVADLSATESSDVEVKMFVKENDIPAREYASHVHIIETKSHFHLLIAVFSRDKNFYTTQISYIYKYQLSSSELETVEGCELTVQDFPVENSRYMFPCRMRETTFGKQSMWMFSGTKVGGSALVELSLDDNGKLVQRTHKPPPFSCVSVMVVSQLNSQFLASLEYIDRYLARSPFY